MTLRLKFADEGPEQQELFEKTPADVAAALRMWRAINAELNQWAVFEVIQDNDSRRVWIEWGHIHADGTKEIAIQTIDFHLDKDGEVYEVRRTHN